MAEKETRIGTITVETRDAEPPRLVGYAAVFHQEAVIGSLFREQIAVDAFDGALGRDDVRALFNHDPNYVLGRTTAGTLRLQVDARGLRYEVDPPATQWAQDLMRTIARGDVSQSSFAFRVTHDEWTAPATAGGLPLRTVRAVELFDVSPVTYPAYNETSIAARDAAAVAGRPRSGADLSADRDGADLARWRVRIAQGDYI